MDDLPYFIVFHKETMIPLCVGQQISSEVARYCASAKTKIFYKDLYVEEVNLEEKVK